MTTETPNLDRAAAAYHDTFNATRSLMLSMTYDEKREAYLMTRYDVRCMNIERVELVAGSTLMGRYDALAKA